MAASGSINTVTNQQKEALGMFAGREDVMVAGPNGQQMSAKQFASMGTEANIRSGKYSGIGITGANLANRDTTESELAKQNAIRGGAAAAIGGLQSAAANQTFVGAAGNYATASAIANGNMEAAIKITEITSETVKNLPSSIAIGGHQTIEVTINGADVLQELEPSIQDLVAKQINRAFKKYIDSRRDGV
jgi:hypothetical protein